MDRPGSGLRGHQRLCGGALLPGHGRQAGAAEAPSGGVCDPSTDGDHSARFFVSLSPPASSTLEVDSRAGVIRRLRSHLRSVWRVSLVPVSRRAPLGSSLGRDWRSPVWVSSFSGDLLGAPGSGSMALSSRCTPGATRVSVLLVWSALAGLSSILEFDGAIGLLAPALPLKAAEMDSKG